MQKKRFKLSIPETTRRTQTTNLHILKKKNLGRKKRCGIKNAATSLTTNLGGSQLKGDYSGKERSRPRCLSLGSGQGFRRKNTQRIRLRERRTLCSETCCGLRWGRKKLKQGKGAQNEVPTGQHMPERWGSLLSTLQRSAFALLVENWVW